MGARLFPKLRRKFAEFLSQSYPAHLRFLTPPTCVRLRYGQLIVKLRGFSWKHGISHFLPQNGSRHHLSELPKGSFPDLPRKPSYRFGPGQPTPGCTYPSPSPHRTISWQRNINLFPIDYAFQPHLRGRLTLGGRALPRKP